MKRSLYALIGCFLFLIVLGCETTRGFGKDVEKTGKNIQKTVDKND